ncbi:A24 family peptidase [Halocynthiibacter namhaensis]|uniref:A24 family peptidase n=1 Tax=Halocynthiibacter namhaensis TaxID=1290553 RepID=UPI000578EAE8|nr:prepilin peptidase [Halocynthiibacter namhaensis]
METTYYAALWFLPFVLPICLFVAWNDMKFMKIPNVLVLAMLAVFLVLGPIALGFDTYLWRLVHFAVILLAGFILNATGQLGGGDAKFCAAMAPFIAYGDLVLFLGILAASLLAAFFGHRALRMFPRIQMLTPEWKSWSEHKFPMGLALGMAMVIYLAMALRQGL